MLDERNDDNQARPFNAIKAPKEEHHCPLILAQNSEHAGYQQDNEHDDNTYSVYKHNRPLMVTMVKQ
ncbi:hypothetical protein VCR15J2_650020 [Vibrio coralliirubri]|nr:hypothetical protein VCR15J2_650020 [Vibrio coralliirubri]